MPGLRDQDRQARGRGLDPLPEPQRLPGTDAASTQALRLAWSDGHRGLWREARPEVLRRADRALASRDLRPDGRAGGGARGLPAEVGGEPDRVDRALAR